MTEAAAIWSGGVPRLAWKVGGAMVDVGAAVPSIALELEVEAPGAVEVRSVLLRAQVRIAVRLPLPCSYDFEVGTAKYLYGLPDGVVPLDVLLSGTVFSSGEDGELRTALLADESELRYDLDSTLLRRAMDRFFPGAAWICISRATFDRLWALRSRRALPTWGPGARSSARLRLGGSGVSAGAEP